MIRFRSSGPVVLGLIALVACSSEKVAGPPTVTAVVVTPGADTLVALGQTRQFHAEARDASGNPVGGVTLVWRSSNPAVATVDSLTGVVTAVANGLSVIRAVAGGVQGQATLAVAQVVASVVVTPPTAGLNTVGVTQAFTAVAKDSGNATVAGVRFLWQSSDPSVAIIDTAGVALARGPGQTTITAAGRGIPGSAALTVMQTGATLVFTVGPTTTVAGEAINPAIQVEVRDAAGNLVTSARPAITIDFQTRPGSGTLHGSTTVNAVGGVATFSGLSIEAAGPGYSLQALSPPLSPAGSGQFTILAAAPKALQFVTPVVQDTAGQPLPLQVRAVDRFGNLTTSVNGAVFLGFLSNPTGATLINGTFSAAMTAGVAPLTIYSIQKTGIYRFVTTGSAALATLDSAFSPNFTVNPATPVALAFTQQPNISFFGERLLAIGVRPQDTFGNTTITPTTTTLTVGASPWGGVLVGTTIRSGTGALTFDSLRLDKPGIGYTIIASAPGLAPDTTSPFPVTIFGSSAEAAGGNHSCALFTTGIAACWGDNTYGQLGRPAGSDSIPGLVTGARVFTQLTGGDRHTCGLDGAGAAWCWGDNAQGQLGNAGAGATSSTPVPVGGGHQFTVLSAGGSHTCGIATGGVAYCWGSNAAGQLGDSGKVATFTATPTAVHGGVTYRTIAAGQNHTCAIAADSTPRCWGDDTYGQLGDSTLTIGGSDTAVMVRGNLHARGIDAGASHSCATTATGAFCWGRNNHGQLGNANLGVNSDKPVAVTGAANPLAGVLSLGGDHSCATTAVGNSLHCWGSNAAGELGNGSAPTDGAQAILVPTGGGGALNVAAGTTHTCSRRAVGAGGLKLYCWGGNASGQVGDGTRTNRSVITLVREQN